MRTHRTAIIALSLALPVLLAGCVGTADAEIGAFDRARGSSDELPEGLDPDVDARVDGESTRLLADVEGVAYFVARSNDKPDDTCLVVVVSADSWTAGCAASLPIIVEMDGAPAAQLTALSGFPDAAEWTQAGDNLALKR